VDFVTGSTRFGSISANTHIITGSMYVTGAFYVTTGSVGIGTTSPSKLLHLYNTAATDVMLVESTQVFSTIAFKSSTNSSTVTIGIDGAGNAAFENKLTTGAMAFVTSGSERMRITSAGYVGIGTNNPSYLFHVVGSATGNGALIYSGNSSSNYSFVVGDYATNTNFHIRGDGYAYMRNFLGIGEGTPTAKLHISVPGSVGSTIFTRIERQGGYGSFDTYLNYESTYFANGNTADFQLNGISYLKFVINNPSTEYRILSKGYFKASNTGTYNSSTGAYHELIQSSIGNSCVRIIATDSGYYDAVEQIMTVRTNNSGFSLSSMYTNNFGDLEFNFRGDGQAYADGSWNPGGADYAEFFEWVDGNPNNEDRRGYAVSLVNNKIKIAEQGEIIIGIISGNPSIIGDSAWNKWAEKYLRDDFGTYIRNESGDRVLNSNYNPNEEYIPREKRPEWSAVGLMGKLCIRKGQEVMPNWVKMKDISDNIEQWLIK
jgi:hypothetical protein